MSNVQRAGLAMILLGMICLSTERFGHAQEPQRELLLRPKLFLPLTEPPCSYCSTEHRKGLVQDDDLVVSWIRGVHNGGVIPVRHFLAGPRVINDTYGLFFYDPDGGYIAAYKKDYGYEFAGWRGGVMLVRGPDATLWSALTGRAVEGAQEGNRLERIPSFTTHWGYWRMLHPESTTYNLFEGKRYSVVDLPDGSTDAQATVGPVDDRLNADQLVLGVERKELTKAYALDQQVERGCFNDEFAGKSIAVLWYGPTGTATAFEALLDGQQLSFYADDVSPESAPFKDRETGTRWTIAGRAVDGPLRGKELTWVPSIQCRWYAWSGEYPQTSLFIPQN